MAKFVAMAAVLVALLAMSAAIAFRTTITTVVNEQIPSWQQHGGQQQQCQQQIQQQSQELRHCVMYLSQDQMSSHFIRMKSSRWGMPQQQQQQQHLSQCCNTLENFDRQCRCNAVKQALRWLQQEQEQEQEQGQGQEQEQEQGQEQEQEQEQGQGQQLEQQILKKAKYLPQVCNLEPQKCQIRTFYF